MGRMKFNEQGYSKEFDLLGNGDTFKALSGYYYMKIPTVAHMKNMEPCNTYNAICLSTGDLAYVNPAVKVCPVTLEVNVKLIL